jgi:hypothetical protein
MRVPDAVAPGKGYVAHYVNLIVRQCVLHFVRGMVIGGEAAKLLNSNDGRAAWRHDDDVLCHSRNAAIHVACNTPDIAGLAGSG